MLTVLTCSSKSETRIGIDMTPTITVAINWIRDNVNPKFTIEAVALVQKQPSTCPGFIYLLTCKTGGSNAEVAFVNTEHEIRDLWFATEKNWCGSEDGNIFFRRLCARFWVGQPENVRPCIDLVGAR